MNPDARSKPAGRRATPRPVRRLRCPIAYTLDVVGDRWSMLILRDMFRGRRRFAALADSVEGIPPAILTARLRLLEHEGIVVRRMYSDHPPRAEYHLTAKGHDLGPVVGALATWGEKYSEHDFSIIDEECGHGLSVIYHCQTCERRAPRSRVRIVEGG